jgi:AraC-like DNA-binding protein
MLMTLSEPITHNILSHDTVVSPLGTIPLVAEIFNGRGVMPRTPLRTFGTYAAVFIERGAGEYEDANGVRVPISAGDLILVFPELAHSYGPASQTTWDELYFIFGGPAFDAWRGLGILDPRRPIARCSGVKDFESKVREIASPHGFSTPDLKTDQICKLLSMLTRVLGESTAQVPIPTTVGRPSSWITRACAHLSGDLDKNLTIDDFAKRMQSPGETYRKRFKAEMGVSPVKFRNQRRIADEFHFSKRFKAQQGANPSEFRAGIIR